MQSEKTDNEMQNVQALDEILNSSSKKYGTTGCFHLRGQRVHDASNMELNSARITYLSTTNE